MKQGSLDRRRKEDEGKAHPAAMCGECCHHYSNVMQISYFQLIPHFAGNGTLNQGRDNMREGDKRKTSKGDESNQNRANDTDQALS